MYMLHNTWVCKLTSLRYIFFAFLPLKISSSLSWKRGHEFGKHEAANIRNICSNFALNCSINGPIPIYIYIYYRNVRNIYTIEIYTIEILSNLYLNWLWKTTWLEDKLTIKTRIFTLDGKLLYLLLLLLLLLLFLSATFVNALFD